MSTRWPMMMARLEKYQYNIMVVPSHFLTLILSYNNLTKHFLSFFEFYRRNHIQDSLSLSEDTKPSFVGIQQLLLTLDVEEDDPIL